MIDTKLLAQVENYIDAHYIALNFVLSNGLIWIYPQGVRANSALNAAATV